MTLQNVIELLLHLLTARDRVQERIRRCEFDEIENTSDDLSVVERVSVLVVFLSELQLPFDARSNMLTFEWKEGNEESD